MVPPGLEPVEERGARAADVQVAGGRRSEPDAGRDGHDGTRGINSGPPGGSTQPAPSRATRQRDVKPLAVLAAAAALVTAATVPFVRSRTDGSRSRRRTLPRLAGGQRRVPGERRRSTRTPETPASRPWNDSLGTWATAMNTCGNLSCAWARGPPPGRSASTTGRARRTRTCCSSAPDSASTSSRPRTRATPRGPAPTATTAGTTAPGRSPSPRPRSTCAPAGCTTPIWR